MAGRRDDRRHGRDAVLSALPLGLAVLMEGAAFGILARGDGIAPAAAVAMSAVVFSGSAQFTALAIAGGGGSLAAVGVTVALVNARSLPMTLAVVPELGRSRVRRALESQLVTDESWALAQVAPGRWSRHRLAAAAAVLWVGWVAGTAAGVAGAAPLASPASLGLDAAVPAVFLALLAPLLADRASRAAAVAGAAVAAALVPLLPAGLSIAGAALVPLVISARRP